MLYKKANNFRGDGLGIAREKLGIFMMVNTQLTKLLSLLSVRIKEF